MSMLVEYTEPKWRDLNMRTLKLDEAYFYLKSLHYKDGYLYMLSKECYKCPYTKLKALYSTAINGTAANEVIRLNVAQSLKFKIFDKDVGRYGFDNETALCTFEPTDLKEFGVYNLTLHANGTCDVVTDKQGVEIYYAFLTVFLIFAILLLLIKGSLYVLKRYRYDEVGTAASPASATSVESKLTVQRKRMRSLDGFRGMAIVLMIFVNSGGGKYWWMEHAPWNGLHVADIVFPSFLWIMGVCIPISVKSQLTRGATKLQICRRIAWRSIKLFLIGLCLNSLYGPQLSDLRIMGVLQRFGIAFLVCGILHTFFATTEYVIPQRIIYDLMLVRGELIVMLLLIFLYIGIVFGLNVPDCPRGYLGPGGKADYAAYSACVTGGATGYIDFKILGSSHMYQHPTAKAIYDGTAFDPEGVFGCVLTIVQVLFGIIAGIIILVHTEWRARINRWLCWSFLLGVLGGILCGFTREDGAIPINKNLWSLSYVFVTCALAFLLLSILYYVIDVREWWNGYPFVESGMNAIILYVGHTIMHKMLPWHWRIGPMNTHFITLLEAVWNTTLWITIALYLDHLKFYYSL